MFFELYIITTVLSALYIFYTELDGAIVIGEHKIVDILFVCLIVFCVNWLITPFVVVDLMRRIKR